MNLDAWNAGGALAMLCLICCWEAGGRVWWAARGLTCEDCGRAKVSCSCVDVIFTADDVWGDDDEDL